LAIARRAAEFKERRAIFAANTKTPAPTHSQAIGDLASSGGGVGLGVGTFFGRLYIIFLGAINAGRFHVTRGC
jgi:hypothetical protein